MSDFKAKMHQIVCRLGLRPRPRWGSLQRSPRPPSLILGAYFYGKGEGTRGEGRGGDEERVGKGREGKGRKGEGRERGKTGTGERRDGEGRRQGRSPKLKLAPQNYFPGAGTDRRRVDRAHGDVGPHGDVGVDVDTKIPDSCDRRHCSQPFPSPSLPPLPLITARRSRRAL